jgi:hypothetical protein
LPTDELEKDAENVAPMQKIDPLLVEEGPYFPNINTLGTNQKFGNDSRRGPKLGTKMLMRERQFTVSLLFNILGIKM